nr:E3 ubiquitin-protein ligase dbl4-like isoform X2 [Malus domestica]
MFSIDGCLHRYCFSCMRQHVEVKFFNGMVAECPHEGCKTEVNIDGCAKFLAPKLVEAISQRIRESAIPVTDKVYCPNPRCSALMSKSEVPWHFNMNCYDYKRSHPYPRPEDQLMNSLATKKHWRQCVKCNHMVELAEGCYHITCRCGYEFCYTCGAQWKNKKATCNCPIWVERNIIREQPRQAQPRHAQPFIREQPRQAQPVQREQPRQAQPLIREQPWQAQPIIREQPRQVRPRR